MLAWIRGGVVANICDKGEIFCAGTLLDVVATNREVLGVLGGIPACVGMTTKEGTC